MFGRGSAARTGELIPPPYVVLTTPRASAALPELLEGAEAVHEVGPGRVDELAAELRPRVQGSLLVALGGGRVIDVAKALAAADPPRRVAAIPTTLSGAEMTAVHRHAVGVDPGAPRVRPAIVVNDPALSASQPEEELARSAANALGHAVEGPLTPLSNPVARLAGLEAARLIASGFGGSDRDAIAVGALLAGYTIGSSGYGLHHVVSQTIARLTRVGHDAANAIMLPHSLRALRARFPDGYLAALEQALGGDPVAFAAELRDAGGLARLSDGGVSEADLDLLADEAAARPELHMTSPPAQRGELRELYAAAL